MNAVAKKIDRIQKALSHQIPDRVPVGEFFWTGFIHRCCAKWGTDFDPYRYFDLDYVVINPNMDPRIRPFEILQHAGEEIVIKTGFGAVIRRSGSAPMPYYESFAINSPEEMADFEFDSSTDRRRFYQGGDDQINGVGDALARDLPAWDTRVSAYCDDFAVFGSVCEPYEYLWRCIGTENALFWMATEPELLAEFIDRIGSFLYSLCQAQIIAGQGRLSGMYLWGDVAYGKGLLFGLPRWQKLFKPHVKALIDLCHRHGLPVIYHGCGNATELFEDMIAIGLDAYNPLEVKAGLDVVELKKRYGGRLAFCGNIDVPLLERGNLEEVQKHIMYKLQAAQGGGWIFQSDHSISSNVDPETYAFAIKTLGEFGNYPLTL